jgi:hypothetical protein
MFPSGLGAEFIQRKDEIYFLAGISPLVYSQLNPCEFRRWRVCVAPCRCAGGSRRWSRTNLCEVTFIRRPTDTAFRATPTRSPGWAPSLFPRARSTPAASTHAWAAKQGRLCAEACLETQFPDMPARSSDLTARVMYVREMGFLSCMGGEVASPDASGMSGKWIPRHASRDKSGHLPGHVGSDQPQSRAGK